MELKRVKVVRLECDGPSHIHKQLEGDLSYHDKSSKRFNFTWTYHLYFILDDEIKKGEWFYSIRNLVEQATLDYPKGEHIGKIIATTDPELKLEASPTQAFVKKYCKVDGIDEVLVEYYVDNTMSMLDISDDFPMPESSYLKLKIDSHNTITIHPFKNSWDRKEVELLLLKFASYCQESDDNAYKDNKWIKENLN